MRDHAPTHALDLGRISRRAAIGAIGLGAAASLAHARAAHPAAIALPGLGPEDLGWDAVQRIYALADLPYPHDALEPYIDAQTMRIHHDIHHRGYVNGLNKAIAWLTDIRNGQENAQYVKHWAREISFHGAGHVNHALFWLNMAPNGKGGGGRPEGPIADAIERDFGSFEQFVAQFKAVAASVEGSGWGWLVYEPIGNQLLTVQGEKQQNLAFTGVVPLLGVDVWEHAYYLKYQNKRGDYLDAFMNVVNWSRVGKTFEAVRR